MRNQALKTFNTSIFDRVLDHGEFEEKARLCRQLAGLACDDKAPELEKQAIVGTLLRLSEDPVKEIRAILGQSLVGASELARDLIFSIISDDDDIALPFLAKSRALDKVAMLAVLKVGDLPRQLVLVARADLHETAISFACDKCARDVCAAMLDNDQLHLTNENYRRLYVRFRDEGEITERLLARSDLPLEVRILQAKRASRNVHQLMADRGWIAPANANDIIVDAEEKTILEIMSKAGADEVDRLIGFLSAKNMLTTSIILRALVNGQMQLAMRSIAYLSRAPLKNLVWALDNNSPGVFKSAYKKASLPRRYLPILLAAVEVHQRLKTAPNRVAANKVGPLIVETLMTGFEDLNMARKTELLDIIAKLGPEPARALALSLIRQVDMAA